MLLTRKGELEEGASFWVRVLRDVGFPIFVALYLLLRVDPAINRMEQTMRDFIAQQERVINVLQAQLLEQRR